MDVLLLDTLRLQFADAPLNERFNDGRVPSGVYDEDALVGAVKRFWWCGKTFNGSVGHVGFDETL
jgi:hypothetical protein